MAASSRALGRKRAILMGTLRTLRRAVVPASLALTFGSLAWWLTDWAPPVEIRGVSIRSEAVPRGGALTVDYQVEQRRSCPGVVQRIVVDSLDVVQFVEPQLLHVHPVDDVSGNTRVTVSVPVPAGAAPGPARYQALIRFQCNPLQTFLGSTIDVHAPVIRFRVLPEVAGQRGIEPAPGDAFIPSLRHIRLE